MNYVALLRGINLGKHRRIAMATLRQILDDLGYLDVKTYLQSGNAVFRLPKATSTVSVEAQIRDAISRELDMDVAVLVRTAQEMAEVVARCPFENAAQQPKDAHVYFLDKHPTAAALASAQALFTGPDNYVVGDRAIYVWFEDRFSASSLTDKFWAAFGVTTTARNWRTVMNLAELSAQDQ